MSTDRQPAVRFEFTCPCGSNPMREGHYVDRRLVCVGCGKPINVIEPVGEKKK